MTYFPDLSDIHKRYQFISDGYSWRDGQETRLYSHNDLIGAYHWGDRVFDWYRHDLHLGYLRTGSTLMLPEGATEIQKGG